MVKENMSFLKKIKIRIMLITDLSGQPGLTGTFDVEIAFEDLTHSIIYHW